MSERIVTDCGMDTISKRNKSLLLRRYFDDEWPNDQDRTCFRPDIGAYAVADGVSGGQNGAQAAEAACEAFMSTMEDLADVETAEEVSDQLERRSIMLIQAAVLKTRGAATLAGVKLTPDGKLSYLSVGDSQLLLRRRNILINSDKDDTSDFGDEIHPITIEQARNGNQLTLHLGVDQGGEVNPGFKIGLRNYHALDAAQIGELTLQAQDRLVLVTDGVLGDLEQDRLTPRKALEYTRRQLGAKAAATALTRNTTKSDDSTAIVIDIGKKTKTSLY